MSLRSMRNTEDTLKGLATRGRNEERRDEGDIAL
jgi:hypothetical protein